VPKHNSKSLKSEYSVEKLNFDLEGEIHITEESFGFGIDNEIEDENEK
jgi:hypothetical protein